MTRRWSMSGWSWTALGAIVFIAALLGGCAKERARVGPTTSAAEQARGAAGRAAAVGAGEVIRHAAGLGPDIFPGLSEAARFGAAAGASLGVDAVLWLLRWNRDRICGKAELTEQERQWCVSAGAMVR